uniref:Armadillo repeat-containing domain-containing protein n=1 Tax=Rhodosorus marinus TaxID=101924 RepID=A0A7S2ZFH6_9RHOD|mmetsp:Transcript_1656/g.6169  ORF Transcript_1656/g.6169 Transcript_1656/m.6169 type:complete len:561 (+) Transcript_1656:475-2157(+)
MLRGGNGMRILQALRYGSVRWKYTQFTGALNPRKNLLKPLVGSAVMVGMGLGMGTALCEDPPQLTLFSDGIEPLMSERNKTKMYLDDLLTSMEQDEGLKQASRSDLPAELSVMLKSLLASENVDYDIYIRILKVISRLSEKQTAALKFLKTDALDSIYEVLKDVVGWPWESSNYAKKMLQRVFPPGGDDSRMAEKTPQGVLMSELCSKILANVAKVALDYHPFVKDNRINLCNRMIKGSENVETRRNMLLMLACIVSKEDFPEDGGTTLRVILESICEDNPDPVSQWYATGGLRNMCKNSSLHKNLVMKGAIPALVNVLLTSPEPKAQALAASAAADLATSAYGRAEVIRMRMVDSMTFEALGRTLKSSNQGVLRSTSKAIDAILSGVPLNDRARQPIVDQFKTADVPRQITRLSLGRLPPVVSAATSCLYTLAAIDGLSELALEAGAARVIIGACNSFDPGMASRALDALAQMSESSERTDYLVQAGVLRVVLAIRSTNPVITYPLTLLLANLTRKEELRAEVAHEGGLVLLNAVSTPFFQHAFKFKEVTHGFRARPLC